MTRRERLIAAAGVAFLVVMVFYAATHRYEWRAGRRDGELVRIDRWRGIAETGRFTSGQWESDTKRWKTVVAAKPVAVPPLASKDVNLAFEPKPHAASPGCTEEAIKAARDPLRGVDCALSDGFERK